VKATSGNVKLWLQERFLLHPKRNGCRVSFVLGNGKTLDMRTMDLRTSFILDLLRAGIPGASLDYDSSGELHRFLISSEGLMYELSFIERLLNASNVDDIRNALELVIDRVRARAVPRRMNFGAMAARAGAWVDVA